MVAILVGLAIIPHTYYLNRAKVKELISLARGCLQEAVSICLSGSNFSNFTSIEACNNYPLETTYLENIKITPRGNCESDIVVNATGKIKGRNTTFCVTCTYDHTNEQMTCTTPIETS